MLSKHFIHQLVQDPNGFFWLATDNGVYRYDGYRTVSLNYLVQGLARLAAAPHTLVQGPHGDLWILGELGLFRYSTTHHQLTPIPLPHLAVDYSTARQALALDTTHGCLWLSATGHEVLAISLRTGLVVPGSSRPFAAPVSHLVSTVKGGVWVQTAIDRGLAYLLHGRLGHRYQGPNPPLLPLPAAHSQQFVGARGLYLAGAGGRLREVQRWLPPSRLQTAEAPAFWPPLQPGHEQWIVGNRLVCLQRQASNGPVTGATVERVQLGLSPYYDSDLLYNVFTDALGTEWCFNAEQHGCYKRRRNLALKHLTTATGQFYSSRAILRLPNKVLLIGSNSGSLLQPAGQPNAPLRPWPGQRLQAVFNALLPLTANQVLALTTESSQLVLLNPTTWHTRPLGLSATDTLFPHPVTALARGRDRVWVSTPTHLYWLNAAQPWLHAYTGLPTGLTLPDTKALAEDSTGHLWLATSEGLFRLALGTGELRRFAEGLSAPFSIPTNALLCLQPVGAQMWVGTRDQGLLLVDPQRGLLRHLTTATGLSSNTVCSLLSGDAGSLWLGTYAGVMRYQLASGCLATFTTADGLADNECNYQSAFRDEDGTLYFGGIKGVTRISPAQLNAQGSFHRQLVVSRVALYVGRDTLTRLSYPTLQAQPPLRLTDDDQAAVQVALTDYLNPENAHFHYRLLGLADTSWHRPNARHTVHLRELPVGDYTLQVKAESAAGIPATNTLYFPLEVRRTWWKQPLVWGLATLAALALAVAFERRGRWRRKQQHLQLRRQLAYDLHDEVGSLLVRVSLQIQLLKDEAALPTFTANNLLGELQGVSQAISDIVWGIDTFNDTLGSLLDRMREHLAKVIGVTRPIQFQAIGIQQDQVVTQKLRQHLYFIFKEAITNSLRHAHSSTLITVCFAQQGSQLILQVGNDGPLPTARRQGVGLRSMRQRAHAINGQLEASPQPGGGFLVVLRVWTTSWLPHRVPEVV